MNEARILALAALPLLAGTGWLLGLRRPEPSVRYVEPPAAAATAAIASHAEQVESSYPGVIVSGYTADVGSEVSGSVAEVWAGVGLRVRQGDPLLRVDAGTSGQDVQVARAKLEQQRSAVARAQAELGEASDLLKRIETIESGVSEAALFAARSREQQARAALQEIQAGLAIHEADIGQQVSRSKKHVIRAPFDGIVVARFVDPGALLVPGQVVVRVITSDYFVRFAMPPEHARARSSGFAVRVEVPGLRTALAGTVSDIQPEIDPAAQLVFARARLDVGGADSGLLLPGARVHVRAVQARLAGGGG